MLVACVMLLAVPASAQRYIPNYLKSENSFLSDNTNIQDSTGWFEFKEGSNVQPGEVFTTYKSAFGLGNNDAMVLWRTKTDAYPFTEVGHNDYSHALQAALQRIAG